METKDRERTKTEKDGSDGDGGKKIMNENKTDEWLQNDGERKKKKNEKRNSHTEKTYIACSSAFDGKKHAFTSFFIVSFSRSYHIR